MSAPISRNEEIINSGNGNGLSSEEDDTDYTYDYMDYSEYVEDNGSSEEENAAENPEGANPEN
ncbi:MAG: hypothetical protein IKZ85_07350 [Pseudobutyrivibrio sp.]|nr:hypothetical protein [Pseudobutyrivibrio sp.]